MCVYIYHGMYAEVRGQFGGAVLSLHLVEAGSCFCHTVYSSLAGLGASGKFSCLCLAAHHSSAGLIYTLSYIQLALVDSSTTLAQSPFCLPSVLSVSPAWGESLESFPHWCAEERPEGLSVSEREGGSGVGPRRN